MAFTTLTSGGRPFKAGRLTCSTTRTPQTSYPYSEPSHSATCTICSIARTIGSSLQSSRSTGRRLWLERRLRHSRKDGYNVSIVLELETSFTDDVAATKRALALQDGPCILVGHSYGGAVITEAGTDSSVAGLVYIAAHMPDAGENEADDGKHFPSDLSNSGAIEKTADGFTYLDPAQFHVYFAADLSAEQAAFMAQSQVLNFADNFRAVITTAAWRTKPSWMLVAGSDRTISPDLERCYGKRAKSHTVKVAGASHRVYISHPKEVADIV